MKIARGTRREKGERDGRGRHQLKWMDGPEDGRREEFGDELHAHSLADSAVTVRQLGKRGA